MLKAMVQAANTAIGQLRVKGHEEALKQLWDAGDDWCEMRFGDATSRVASTMKTNGIKIEVQHPDGGAAEAKVITQPTPSPALSNFERLVQAFIATGLLVEEGTGATLAPTGFVPFFTPSSSASPTFMRRTDPRQGM